MVGKIEKVPEKECGEEDGDYNARLMEWSIKASALLADEVRERIALEIRLGNAEKEARDLKQILEEQSRRSDAIADVAKEFAKARVSYCAPGSKAKLLSRVPEHWVVPNPESLPLPAMRFDN